MNSDSQHIGKYAATQSLAEVGLGSLLHSLHIPLSGHFLSLNQGLLLTFGVRSLSERSRALKFCSTMALVVALLKSLSPAGKKLMPMLAIAMQGNLYALGIGLMGSNYFGAALGFVLLSLWAFAQPLLVNYILLGKEFFIAVEKLWSDLATSLSLPIESGIWILLGLVALKAIIAFGLSTWAWRNGAAFELKYLEWIKKIKKTTPTPIKKNNLNPSLGAIRDLLNPWFIFSLSLTALFFIFSQEKSHLDLIFYILRALAIAFVFFLLIRMVPQSWYEKLASRFPSVRVTLDQSFRDD